MMKTITGTATTTEPERTSAPAPHGGWGLCVLPVAGGLLAVGWRLAGGLLEVGRDVVRGGANADLEFQGSAPTAVVAAWYAAYGPKLTV